MPRLNETELQELARKVWADRKCHEDDFYPAWRGGLRDALVQAEQQSAKVKDHVHGQDWPSRARTGHQGDPHRQHRRAVQRAAELACRDFDPMTVANRERQQAREAAEAERRQAASEAIRLKKRAKVLDEARRAFLAAGGSPDDWTPEREERAWQAHLDNAVTGNAAHDLARVRARRAFRASL